MASDDTLQAVFVAGNISEADIVRGLLVANGIPAVIQNESAVSMLDGMVTGNRGVPVMVNAKDLEAARQVIAENHRSVGEFEEE